MLKPEPASEDLFTRAPAIAADVSIHNT
jgi:hypothetical protein